MTRIQQIAALGQSIWIDHISRELLASGQLEALIDDGVLGMTSNPTIFQNAIASGAYDALIENEAARGAAALAIYEKIAIQEVGAAADALRPVYNETHGRDGYVSLEVRPMLAHDTDATVEEARRLFAALNRPNIMIKVPATEAGLKAITTLIGEGVNVNVTLIFAVAMYERVAKAYLDGLRIFEKTTQPLSKVASVASFFVSRVDSNIDKQLNQKIEAGQEHLEELLGKAAIANARVAYSRFKDIFDGDAFIPFRAHGARVQRPLWGSTSTKNPSFPDTLYCDALIGPNTVNTMPLDTLEAVRDHGLVAQTIEQDMGQALGMEKRLREIAGIDLRQVTDQLLEEGLQKFVDSFEQLLNEIEQKRAALAA